MVLVQNWFEEVQHRAINTSSIIVKSNVRGTWKNAEDGRVGHIEQVRDFDLQLNLRARQKGRARRRGYHKLQIARTPFLPIAIAACGRLRFES